MAQRRMFSLKVVDTDLFLDMPSTTQNLYFHLSMRADDDGFISSPKKIMRFVGCSDDDMRILTAKQFIIPFQSGICVIKHWKIHNYIQRDRYEETIYQEEKSNLEEVDKQYVMTLDTKCIQNGDTGKVRKGKSKVREGKSNNYSTDYKSVYEYYLKFDNLKQHRKYTPEMSNAIKLFLRNTHSTIQDCYKVIERHSKVVESTKSTDYPVRPRPIQQLFGQRAHGATHLIGSDYLDDGKYAKGKSIAISENTEKPKREEYEEPELDINQFMYKG